MTGRAAGYCAGYNMPGFMNQVGGRGRGGGGRGRGGGGRGWRHMFHATGLPGWQRAAGAWAGGLPTPVTTEQQVAVLKSQAAALSDQLEAVNKRLAELASSANVQA